MMRKKERDPPPPPSSCKFSNKQLRFQKGKAETLEKASRELSPSEEATKDGSGLRRTTGSSTRSASQWAVRPRSTPGWPRRWRSLAKRPLRCSSGQSCFFGPGQSWSLRSSLQAMREKKTITLQGSLTDFANYGYL